MPAAASRTVRDLRASEPARRTIRSRAASSMPTAPASPRSSASARSMSAPTSSAPSGRRVSSRERDSRGETTEKLGFSVVAATRTTQRFSTPGSRALLGAREAVHLVDEQDRLLAPDQVAARVPDDLPHPPDPRGHGRQLDEAPPGDARHQVGEGRLARPRRTPQNDAGHTRTPPAGLVGGLHEPAQGRAGGQQVVLAQDLVEAARPHAHGQRRPGVQGQTGVVGPRAVEEVHAATLSPRPARRRPLTSLQRRSDSAPDATAAARRNAAGRSDEEPGAR